MKSIFSKPSSVLRASVLAVIFMSVGSTAMAASQCKGLSDAKCGEAASCSWVEGYERKDGRKVKSFCRTKFKGNIAKRSAKKGKKAN